MEDLQRLYPIGIQTFSKIREGNYLYIDKTAYVYRMTHSASGYMFLSRPRRFGKSLLTSTLHSYFSGRKELFRGLAIEKLEKEWIEHPVLHFDMSTAKHVDKEQLLQELNLKLSDYELIYGKAEEEVNPNQRLIGVVKRAYEQTGKKVVVLIDEYDAPTETITTITSLLYQSGYITIKDYDKELDIYTLDIPNKEVRLGLMESLLPHYVANNAEEANTMVAYLSRDIRNGDMDAAMCRLQTFLSTIPQCDNTKYEGHYQQMFYIIFSLLNFYVDVEVRTPRGRVDMVLRTKTTLYVMELKLDETANEAMEQIDLKNYPERFALCGLPIVKVAVNFDSERCTIGEWRIE